ncbi:MAG: ACP S-malonyltransferase [Syntrophales bacterium]
MGDTRICAAVFPGQGSQRPGMGRDFFEQMPESRAAYEEAADSLGWDVAAVCFSDDARLDLTEYTQPCLVTTEIAMLRGLAARYGFCPTLFGGHSLGEFTALVAAGALPFAASLKIVQARGRLMQSAVPAGVGAMTAVIADDLSAEGIEGPIGGLAVDIANINSSRQIVLSGEAGAIAEAETRLRAALDVPALRFVRLNVSAPFHSRLLEPICAPFRSILGEWGGGLDAERAGRVVSNYRGGFHSGGREEIIESLALQISHTVQWKQNMTLLASQAGAIWEIGPGRPLRDFFRTIGVACTSVTTLASAEKAFSATD